jgi:hypothetical protein
LCWDQLEKLHREAQPDGFPRRLMSVDGPRHRPRPRTPTASTRRRRWSRPTSIVVPACPDRACPWVRGTRCE